MAPPEARIIASEHPDKVRMLVLETDDPHPDTQEEKGSFGEVLNDLLVEAGEQHDPKLAIETIIHYAVEPRGGRIPEPPEITDDIHAILITGSVYDAHSDEAWVLKLLNLIKHLWVHRPDIKFTGICFGHQILCRALGSTVEPEENGKWELAHTHIELSDVGRWLFRLDSSEKHIHLHQMHIDLVVDPPSASKTDLLDPSTEVHVWGTSDHTGVQGVYIPTRLFTTQGHMEFDDKMVKRQLEMRVQSGAVESNVAEKAAERAEWQHDGLLVAKAVLRFFHGDDDKAP
ncbi:class I glutamine amidotransferase-like protein [Paraphaeosphaeria sporulosa]|uniref:Class I glutamine amidotransferase-like protein n=1 Tax=Paraphaeosphaeria sporulosa TaxID=1460663 RepID=A0A177BUM3_9PLEO|nr:class I glutamine amidotransferase-like protein [Paraphaeosphaeria sporulosa]OAF98994.1 class I glutamine amidotransferase-like protein [Paraphaeosphaeria sporulosa]